MSFPQSSREISCKKKQNVSQYLDDMRLLQCNSIRVEVLRLKLLVPCELANAVTKHSRFASALLF